MSGLSNIMEAAFTTLATAVNISGDTSYHTGATETMQKVSTLELRLFFKIKNYSRNRIMGIDTDKQELCFMGTHLMGQIHNMLISPDKGDSRLDNHKGDIFIITFELFSGVKSGKKIAYICHKKNTQIRSGIVTGPI